MSRRFSLSLGVITLAAFFPTWCQAEDAVRTGNATYLAQKYWAPNNLRVTFEPSGTAGVARSFSVCFTMTEENLTLYRTWILTRHNIVEYPYPFVLEIKLVTPNKSIDWTGKRSGVDWFFGETGKTTGESGTAGVYLDSQDYDWITSDTRNLGIGIPLPAQLNASEYCYSINLTGGDGSFSGTQLEVRLGIEVWVAGRLHYNPSERFDINDLWQIQYGFGRNDEYPDGAYCPAESLYRTNPQDIADKDAFGITNYQILTPQLGSNGMAGTYQYRLKSTGGYELY